MAEVAPVYLFIGPEFGERNEAVDKVKSDLKAKYGDFEDHVRYYPETKLSEVVSELSTDSLFSPATCIVLKNAEQIKLKDEIELLKNWVESVTPSPLKSSVKDSSVLILISDEVSVDAKLKKIIPAGDKNQKIFWEMFENRKEPWLQNYFKKNGFSLTSSACQAILEMVENNTESLKSECSAFFSFFPKGYQITEADVEKVLSHNREENAFTLFDAMADVSMPKEKRLEKALLILQKISSTKNSGVGVELIAGLSYCFRRLVVWHEISKGGSASDTVYKQNGFTSMKAKNQYANASRIWNMPQTVAAKAVLSKYDMEIRSSGNTQEYNLLSLMIYEIVMKNATARSEYETDWEIL